jgi:hypothetical protein
VLRCDDPTAATLAWQADGKVEPSQGGGGARR